MDIEEKRRKQREAQARYRERQKALGIKPKPRNEAQKAQQAEYMRQRREDAHERGETIPSEIWWTKNRDRHRANVAKWRSANKDLSDFLNREWQERRRSTPWGRITNNMWPQVHAYAPLRKTKPNRYTEALGYLWSDLHDHLKSQFSDGMTWENWGEVWELDHIVPLSQFKYTSLEDPLFREAWALVNLRPLFREENQRKGWKVA